MKYFAYGSNMDQDRMKKRGADFSHVEHVVLKGYSLQFNKMATGKHAKPGEGKGNIKKSDEEDFVEGVLYEITESGRNELDGHEIGYDRIPTQVRLDNGTLVEVFTYIAQQDKVRNGLKPTKEYLSHYLAAKDILSKEYYRKLESWPTLD